MQLFSRYDGTPKELHPDFPIPHVYSVTVGDPLTFSGELK